MPDNLIRFPRRDGMVDLPLVRMAKPSLDYVRSSADLIAELHCEDRPDPFNTWVEQHRREAEERAELDADLSIIGWGLLAGWLFVVCFRLTQLVVLS